MHASAYSIDYQRIKKITQNNNLDKQANYNTLINSALFSAKKQRTFLTCKFLFICRYLQ